MLLLMVVVRTYEEIKECHVFTKHYEPIKFDSQGRHTAIWLDLHSDLPDFWNLEQKTSARDPRLSPSHSSRRPHRRLQDVVFLSDLFRHSHNPSSQAKTGGQPNNSNGSRITCSNAASGKSIEEKAASSHTEGKVDNNLDDTPTPCSESETALSDCSVRTEKEQDSLCMAIVPEKMCTVFLNAHVAGALSTCVKSSQVFRWCLLRNLRKKFKRPTSCNAGNHESEVNVIVRYILDIVSVWPVQRIDYTWGWHINHILTKRMLLEEAMAWLSTLGGAHSSLGEYFRHHAEQAGEISVKQLKVALQLGDPLTVARCHMFWAYSLLQRGQWRKSKVIVRRVYNLASTHSVIDVRLINMCQSAWARLQHLHRAHYRKKRAESPSVKAGGVTRT